MFRQNLLEFKMEEKKREFSRLIYFLWIKEDKFNA